MVSGGGADAPQAADPLGLASWPQGGHHKPVGMKGAFGKIIKVAVERAHEPRRIIDDLLRAEIAEKQVRSIEYHITIAKLPLAKDSTSSRYPTSRSTWISLQPPTSRSTRPPKKPCPVCDDPGQGNRFSFFLSLRVSVARGLRGRFG